LTALTAVVALASAGLFVTPQAWALPQYLSVVKSIEGNPSQVTPGQAFTYEIVLSCSEEDCLDVAVSDPLPVDFAGLTLLGAEVRPATVPHTLLVVKDGSEVDAFPTVISPDTVVSLDVTQPLDSDGSVGLSAGQTLTLMVRLQVPSTGLSPLSPNVGRPIVNTASSTASNSASDASSVGVTISVPQSLATALSKSWSPSSATVGQTSTISLTARNTSNVPVDRLVVTEPAQAGSASSLDENNPFSVVDLTALSCALPSGASAVQVDAWVEQSGSWSWTTGQPGPACALPTGVDPADVDGLRFTFSGDIPVNAYASLSLNVVQVTDAETSLTNTATASTSRDGVASPVVSAAAGYSVKEPTLAVSVNKTFNPTGVPQGNHTIATITATNASQGQPVTSLTVSDDLVAQGFQFIGFPSPITYPAGAETGQVVYSFASEPDQTIAFASGQTPASPASGTVTGFTIVFNSTDGPLGANAQAVVPVRLGTSGGDFGNRPNKATATVSDGVNSAAGERTATVQVVNPVVNGTLSKTISPPWTAISPGQQVVTSLAGRVWTGNNLVHPNSIVVTDMISATPTPGQREFWDGFDLTSIPSAPIPAGSSLLVEVWTGSSWTTLADAGPVVSATNFSLSRLDIETALGGSAAARRAVTGVRFTYTNPTGFPSDITVNPYVAYQARATARSGGSTGDDPSLPWVNSATVEGAVVTDDGGGGSGGGGGSSNAYILGQCLSLDPADCVIIVGPPTQPRPLVTPVTALAKVWGTTAAPAVTVHAQSSQQVQTTLSWDTTPGVASAVISDPPAPGVSDAALAESVFDAFNLVSVPPIDYDALSYTYSNGWALRYDSVTAVELYDRDAAAWVTPSCTPSDGAWMTTSGFRGCTLTAAEQASTIGLRLTLEPNDIARAAASSGSAIDPFAPAVGSGLASAFSDSAGLRRSFTLNWQLRDSKRSDGSWVVRTATYNYRPDSITLEPGWVVNQASLTATPIDPVAVTVVQSEARIQVIDTVPVILLTKTFTQGSSTYPLLVPGDPGTPQSDFPTSTMVLTATNQVIAGLAAKASYIRITEPALTDSDGVPNGPLSQTPLDPASAQADPFAGVTDLSDSSYYGGTDFAGSFFDRFDIVNATATASVAASISTTDSLVHLLRYNGGMLSHQTITALELNSMTESDLADVIGLSITFQGADPVANGGSIAGGQSVSLTLDTRPRATFRLSGAEQRLDVNAVTVAVPNTAFAQSYDPVQFQSSHPFPTEFDRGYSGALSAAGPGTIYLSGGVLATKAYQTISPTSLTEPTRATPITVTLRGDAWNSNQKATELVFEDGPANADFWDNVAFTGLTSVSLPDGADQVSLCAYGAFDGDPAAWVCSAPGPTSTAELAVDAADYPLVQGLRAVFSKADGTEFGNWWGTPSVVFTGLLRTAKLSGGPVEFPGQAANLLNVTSYNWLLLDSNGDPATGQSSVNAQFSWIPGTRHLGLNKVANHNSPTIYPGDSPSTADVVPFELTVSNLGTGYLHLDSVIDQLPPGLRYSPVPNGSHEGDAYILTSSYSGSLTSTLSTTPELEVGPIDPSGQTLEWTWPSQDQGDRLLPGESITITIYGWLELGAYQLGQDAWNQLTVTTAEALTTVSHLAGGPITFSPSVDPNSASTRARVTPHSGVNFRLATGVVGALGTARPDFDPDGVCDPTVSGPGQTEPTYFAPPCVADSVHGGIDSWILHAVNAGTTVFDQVTFFEALPAAEDSMLVSSGDSRGSTFRPHLVAGSLQAVALDSAGQPIPDVVFTFEVSRDTLACQDSWSAMALDASLLPCSSAGETWETVDPDDPDVDWSTVRAIRVTALFSPATPLGPAGTVDILFDTVNVPNSVVGAEDGAESEAFVEVDLVDFAWSQFGATYHDPNRPNPLRLSPNKVGLSLSTGSFTVQKLIEGPGAELAPASFEATLSCSLPYIDSTGVLRSASLRFNGQTDGRLTLSQADGLEAEVARVPLGAVCQVGEAGSVGEFGEVSRASEASNFTVVIGEVNQTILTNVYAARVVPRTGSTQGPPYLALLSLLAGLTLVYAARRVRRAS
jgi:hypothetical protein